MNYEIPNDDADLIVSPEEAKAWAYKIRGNKQHAFWGNLFGENHTLQESTRAVKFVNLLDQIAASGKQGTIKGWLDKHEAEQKELLKDQYGDAHAGEPGSRHSAYGETWQSYKQPPDPHENHDRPFPGKDAKSQSGRGISDVPFDGEGSTIVPEGSPRAFIDRVQSITKGAK